ncbi:MAG: LysR family transcriptional regulator [Hyphomicrobiaceae bacterium]|nr:LysR family transcriptional regulator [Hyphomicrobiaceae bacterium]
MTRRSRPAGLRIRLVFSTGGWIGPGKADLLDGIRETGSIAAAGRRLGMSYKRAWSLTETLNTMFAEPLVESSRGGAQHGGARLTVTGERILDAYRLIERKAERSTKAEIAAIEALLTNAAVDMSEKK